MKRSLAAILFAMALVAFAIPGIARADDRDDDDDAKVPDREIAKILKRVDADRMQETIERLEAFGTRNSCSDTQAPGRGVTPARDFILSRFNQIKGLNAALDPFTHGNCPTTPTFNVLAWLPGTTHPERLVIIGGHYDSRTIDVFDTRSDAPGANDSGAQSSVVLELARVLSQERHPSTLVFVSFSGEEQGLFGSGSIATKFATAGQAGLPAFFQGSKVVAMLNNDIPGGDNLANGAAQLREFRLYSPGTPRETGLTTPDGTPDNTSPARGLMRFIGNIQSTYVPAFQMIPKMREDRPGRASDHRSFLNVSTAAAIIPAVRFVETLECSPSPVDNSCCTVNPATNFCTAPCASPFASLPATDPRRGCILGFNPGEPTSGQIAHQHSPEDRSVFVTAEYAARMARVMAATAATLARAPLAPVNFTATGSASLGVTVSFAPAGGDAIDHFVVAARASNENFYRRRVVTKNTSASLTAQDLGLSTGQSFFISAAAVDRHGRESLFAYPEFRCDSTGCVMPANALTDIARRR